MAKFDKDFIYLSEEDFNSPMWKQERVFSKAEAYIDVLRTKHFESENLTEENIETFAKAWKWDESEVRKFLTEIIDEV